jgi:YggT family protein
VTGGALVGILRLAVIALWVLVLGRVLLSWVDPAARTQLGRVLFQLTEPFLAPIRSVMPRTGMLDLSPLVLFLVLGVVIRVLL